MSAMVDVLLVEGQRWPAREINLTLAVLMPVLPG
jgi:hypothetical protein